MPEREVDSEVHVDIDTPIQDRLSSKIWQSHEHTWPETYQHQSLTGNGELF